MQLGRAGRVFAGVAGLFFGSLHVTPARADEGSTLTAHASTEIAGYHDSTATTVLTPSIAGSVESPTAGWGVNGRYLVDIVTAASPDIVSTASPRWTEVRNAGGLGFRYKPGTFGVAVSTSASYTPDYLALGANGQVTQELDEKNLTLLAGYGYGHDTIGRTGTPFSVFSRSLGYHTINAGLSKVVNKALVIGVYGDAIFESGDQSKPYRYVPIFSAADAAKVPRGASLAEISTLRIQARPIEQLPLERERYAVTGRLAWRGESTTLRLEERGYVDTWGVKATTTDVRYFIDLSERFTVWPHLRVHAQSAVSFWKRAYVGDLDTLPALRTGDRELGALTSLGGGGGLRLALGKTGSVDDWVVTTTVDGNYTSFSDTLYVKYRTSGLAAVGLEVTF